MTDRRSASARRVVHRQQWPGVRKRDRHAMNKIFSSPRARYFGEFYEQTIKHTRMQRQRQRQRQRTRWQKLITSNFPSFQPFVFGTQADQWRTSKRAHDFGKKESCFFGFRFVFNHNSPYRKQLFTFNNKIEMNWTGFVALTGKSSWVEVMQHRARMHLKSGQSPMP